MLQHLIGVPFTLVSFVVVFSVVVFVHEFGHFIVARRCGVRCECFSLGVGPELFGFTDRHGTRWKVCPIPIGGYVRMFGESDEMRAIEGGAGGETGPLTPEEKAVSLKYKPVGQRAAIVFAGPAVNFIFAIVVFTVLFMAFGQQVLDPVVGSVVENSAAAQAGLQPGDRIVAIDGNAIARFDDIQRLVQLGYGAPMNVTVSRDGSEMRLRVTPRVVHEKDALGNMQKTPQLGILPGTDPIVGVVVENSAAAEAGFQPGDRIVNIDGNPIIQFDDIKRLVAQGHGAPMNVTVSRDNNKLQLTVTPRITEEKDASGNTQKTPLLGISSHEMRRLGPIDAFAAAVKQTYTVVEETGVGVGQMITGRRGTDDMGGMIKIAQYSGQAAKSGPAGFVLFMAILSISLGLINLVPVPLLDGGHLLFYAIEAVRGRPLSDRAQEWGFRIGLVLVGSLIVFVNLNDIVHTWNDIVHL